MDSTSIRLLCVLFGVVFGALIFVRRRRKME